MVGFLLILGLTSVEVALHGTAAGVQFRANAYQLLNELRREVLTGLGELEPQVVIVDISAVAQVPDPVTGEAYTPPVILERLIRQVAEAGKPVAIGVDVDLSPVWDSEGANVPPGFPVLMAAAEEMAARPEPVAVYFGVNRAALRGPEDWLRDISWSRFAAWLSLPTEPNFTVPLYLKAGGRMEVAGGPAYLPSMAFALARAGRDTGDDEPRGTLIAEMVEAPEDGLAVPMALNDLGLLDRLEEGALVCAADGTLTAETRARFPQDKSVVLLGKVKEATDKLTPPGGGRARAGVLFHAAGAETLREQKLRMFKHGFGTLIGFLFMTALWARHHFGHHGSGPLNLAHEAQAAWRGGLLWAAVAGGIALAALAFGFLWLEILLVWAFALLHTLFEIYVAARFTLASEARRAKAGIQ